MNAGCLLVAVGLVLGAQQLESPSYAQNGPAGQAAPADSCSDPKDCLNRGARANLNRDYPRAAKFLASGCDIEPKACNIVGEIYRNGQGVPKDGAKAADFHQRACDKGIVLSCAIEAQLRYHGQDGTPVEKGRARIAFERSCNPEFLDSCVNAGVMYSTAEGGPASKEKARALFQKACDSGEQTGCVNVAAMYLSGEGGPVDHPYANQLFEAACEKKNALGCYNAGLVYAKGVDADQDYPRALTLLQKACDGGNALGCEVAKQIRDDLAQKEAQKAAAAAKVKGKKR